MYFDVINDCYKCNMSYYSFRRYIRNDNLSNKEFSKVLGKDITIRKKYMKDGFLDNVYMYIFINDKLKITEIDTVLFGIPIYIENVDKNLYVCELV